MFQVEKSHLIDENKLDQRFYFQSFFQEACSLGLLSEAQIQRIQMELIDLMGKEVERYSNDESSSIRVEKAQELLQSITYSIGHFLKVTTDVTQSLDILKVEKISDLYYKGMKAVSDSKSKAELLLKNLQRNSLKLHNYAYQDTIFTALPEFFHNYNIEFGAHDIPASIDYPINEMSTELMGVEYICDYLERLTMEDGLLRNFTEAKINLLLRGFDSEAEHLLFNIFELVLNNALGCILLSKSSKELHISQEECQWLQEKLIKADYQELQIKLLEACDELSLELKLEEGPADYMKAAITMVARRLMNNLKTNTLNKLFISMEVRQQEEYFEDRISMEDDKLRELIELLRNYDNTTDKIALMKEHIQSTADLIELLEESFYEEEYSEVLASLTEDEKSILRKSILLEYGQGHTQDFDPQTEWQRLLFL